MGTWINAVGSMTQNELNQLVIRAFELGINLFDTAEEYDEGQAEIRLGEAL